MALPGDRDGRPEEELPDVASHLPAGAHRLRIGLVCATSIAIGRVRRHKRDYDAISGADGAFSRDRLAIGRDGRAFSRERRTAP